jgi:hypothetical protein
MSLCKAAVIVVRFQTGVNFLDRFSKNTQTSNFIKIRPVLAKLFHADWQTHRRTDGQTDRYDEVIVAFRNSANAPNTRQDHICPYRLIQNLCLFIFPPFLLPLNRTVYLVTVYLKTSTLPETAQRQIMG